MESLACQMQTHWIDFVGGNQNSISHDLEYSMQLSIILWLWDIICLAVFLIAFHVEFYHKFAFFPFHFDAWFKIIQNHNAMSGIFG